MKDCCLGRANASDELFGIGFKVTTVCRSQQAPRHCANGHFSRFRISTRPITIPTGETLMELVCSETKISLSLPVGSVVGGFKEMKASMTTSDRRVSDSSALVGQHEVRCIDDSNHRVAKASMDYGGRRPTTAPAATRPHDVERRRA